MRQELIDARSSRTAAAVDTRPAVTNLSSTTSPGVDCVVGQGVPDAPAPS